MKNKVKYLYQLADKAGMSAKTARKYLKSGSLPSQCKAVHDWATHPDAFAQDWPWVEDFLKNNTGLESKSLFEALQRECPGKLAKSAEKGARKSAQMGATWVINNK